MSWGHLLPLLDLPWDDSSSVVDNRKAVSEMNLNSWSSVGVESRLRVFSQREQVWAGSARSNNLISMWLFGVTSSDANMVSAASFRHQAWQDPHAMVWTVLIDKWLHPDALRSKCASNHKIQTKVSTRFYNFKRWHCRSRFCQEQQLAKSLKYRNFSKSV